MSFPLIRPEQVEQMPESGRQLLLLQLERECRDAAVRHKEILAARAERLAAERAAAEAEAMLVAAARPEGGYTPQERIEGEAILRARRRLAQQGQRHSTDPRTDDLRAAAAAVRAGSTNGYLLALNRERNRLAQVASRAQRRELARRAS